MQILQRALAEIKAVRANRERTLLWTLSLCVFAFILWSLLFKIDVAATMTGDVVPAGQIKKIMHLEGGIVSKIMVKEGQRVKIGQPLLELSSTRSDADVQELSIKLDSLKVDCLRLEALIDDKPLPSEKAMNCTAGAYMAVSELYGSQKSTLEAQIDEQNQKIELIKLEYAAERAKISNLEPRLKMVNEQIGISRKLMKDGLSNRFEHLDLLKEANSIEGNILESRANAEELWRSIRKERAARTSIREDFRHKWNKELDYARKQISELSQRLGKYVDSQSRTQVVSPVEGTVFRMLVHNPGAVISPGGSIMTIVPGDDSLIIEAQMMVGDVGYVSMGQGCRISLMASAAGGFQPISGVVESISPDAVSEPNKVPYYLVRIRPDAYVFVDGDLTYPLLPGVAVQVSILTGHRSLFMYLLDPVFHGLTNALTER